MKPTKRPKSNAGDPGLTQSRKPLRGRTPLVLIVDDIFFARACVQGVLRGRVNARVVEAETSDDALVAAELFPVDLVISDIVRPGVDGLEFLKVFKRAHPRTPVVIYSGHASGALERRAYRLGAFRCLQKPERPETILRAVQEALELRNPRKGVTGRFKNDHHGSK